MSAFATRTAEEIVAEGLYAEKILVKWSPAARTDHQGHHEGWWATLHWGSTFGLGPQTIAEGEISTRYGEPDPGSALRFVLGLAERLGIRRHEGEPLPVFYEADEDKTGGAEPDYAELAKAVESLVGLRLSI
jgi:hypothetical protein